jgi:hypothetical protein
MVRERGHLQGEPRQLVLGDAGNEVEDNETCVLLGVVL